MIALINIVKEADQLNRAVAHFLDADTAWNNDEISEKDYCGVLDDLQEAMYAYREIRRTVGISGSKVCSHDFETEYCSKCGEKRPEAMKSVSPEEMWRELFGDEPMPTVGAVRIKKLNSHTFQIVVVNDQTSNQLYKKEK